MRAGRLGTAPGGGRRGRVEQVRCMRRAPCLAGRKAAQPHLGALDGCRGRAAGPAFPPPPALPGCTLTPAPFCTAAAGRACGGRQDHSGGGPPHQGRLPAAEFVHKVRHGWGFNGASLGCKHTCLQGASWCGSQRAPRHCCVLSRPVIVVLDGLANLRARPPARPVGTTSTAPSTNRWTCCAT